MENPVLAYKKELIEWIKNLDDLEILAELIELKENTTYVSMVAESRAEYLVKDDFDERFARGISMEESRKRTREFIKNLPWKK